MKILLQALLQRTCRRNAALALSIGSYHSLFGASKRDDEKLRLPVYFWGSNAYGLVAPSLMNDSSASASLPSSSAVIKQPRECTFWRERGLYLRSVAGSERHACAVDSHGDLWQWGEDSSYATPQRTIEGRRLVKCLTTDQMVFALSQDGTLWALPVAKALDNGPSSPPRPVIFGAPEKISDVACGHDHLVAVGTHGALMTGPLNDSGNWCGQLGIGVVDSQVLLASDDQDKERESGGSDSMNDSGPSMNATIVHDWPREDAPSTVLIKKQSVEETERKLLYPNGLALQRISAKSFARVAAGSHHSLAVDVRGTAYAWGANGNLQLGLGAGAGPNSVAVPTPVAGLQNRRVLNVAAGGATSFFHVQEAAPDTGDGLEALYACGNGLFGQLGVGGWHHAIGTPRLVPTVSRQRFYDEQAQRQRPLGIRALWCGLQTGAVLMDTFHGGSSIGSSIGYDLIGWGCNKHYQLQSNRHANVSRPETLVPPSPTLPSVDDRDLALSREGPTAVNHARGLSFLGGQLQVLPLQVSSDGNHAEPAYSLYLGPEFSCLY